VPRVGGFGDLALEQAELQRDIGRIEAFGENYFSGAYCSRRLPPPPPRSSP
jgi:hypothetical protein